jgi:hypothetical protein
MSWNRSAPLIDLELRPSRRLAAFLILAHGLAAAAVLAAGAPLWLRLSLAVAVAGSLFYQLRAGVMGRGAIRRAVWYPDGEWAVIDARGRSLAADLLPGVVSLPWLVLLRLKPLRGGRVRTLLLASDSADADVLRRLRVRLGFETRVA